MHYTIRCEWVKCGKPTCRTCPHGPYWYGYYRSAGKLKKKYFGKGNPNFSKFAFEPSTGNEWDLIFSEVLASRPLACRILGLRKIFTESEARAAARARMFECHPDRGGDPRESRHVKCAWAYLRKVEGW